MLQGLQARTVPAHAQVLAAVADRAPALAAAFLASCTWTAEPQPSLYWCPSVAALRIVTPPMPVPATGTGGHIVAALNGPCASVSPESGASVLRRAVCYISACTMRVSFQLKYLSQQASLQ